MIIKEKETEKKHFHFQLICSMTLEWQLKEMSVEH